MKEKKILTRIRCQGKMFVYLNGKYLCKAEYQGDAYTALYAMGYRWEDLPELPTYRDDLPKEFDISQSGYGPVFSPPETLKDLQDRINRWQRRLRDERIELLTKELQELKTERDRDEGV